MNNPSNQPIVSPYLGVALGILAVSTASLFIKFAREEAASIVIAAYRLSIAVIVLSPFAIIKYRKELRSIGRTEYWLAILSGGFLAIHFWVWISSLDYTNVVSSVVIVTSTPLWVSLAAPILIKEKIGRYVLIGLAFALSGTLLIGFGSGCEFDGGLVCGAGDRASSVNSLIGNGLALLGAWSAAAYVIIGRRLRGGMDLIPYVFLVYGVAASVLVGIMIIIGAEYRGFSADTFLWLILLALVPQLIGHTTLNWALGFLPASVVAVSLLGEPIGSGILAFIFLNEIPGIITLIGATLILIGIIAASRREK